MEELLNLKQRSILFQKPKVKSFGDLAIGLVSAAWLKFFKVLKNSAKAFVMGSNLNRSSPCVMSDHRNIKMNCYQCGLNQVNKRAIKIFIPGDGAVGQHSTMVTILASGPSYTGFISQHCQKMS